jgi:hypothetical protein
MPDTSVRAVESEPGVPQESTMRSILLPGLPVDAPHRRRDQRRRVPDPHGGVGSLSARPEVSHAPGAEACP